MKSLAVAAFVLSLACVAPALAADEAPAPAPMPLVQPLPPAEETPGFQAVRPLAGAEAPAQAVVPPVAVAPPPPVPMVVPAPVAAPAPAPAAPPAMLPPPPSLPQVEAGLTSLLVQGGLAALLIVIGALVAGFVGISIANAGRRGDEARRRKATTSTLIIELEARIQAFESVPVPPNAEAGVSFVSAVAALAGLDYGWRAAQGSLHLLPERLSGSLAVHYAAVNHVAMFVKAQSFAAGLRMLQANRMGGHPCPDAGTMREAHVELAAAFRGLDKIVMGLRAV
jgi:hypothetical protein